jgi:MGT family glycosyltransferase
VAHIAFLTPPAAGHVYPTLGVVAELVARGHRVSYAATDRFAAALDEVGAELVGYRTTLDDAFARPPRFSGNDLVTAMHVALAEVEAVLPGLAAAFAGDEPDLVVCDGAAVSWSGRLLAARWGVPVVQSWPNLVSNRHWSLARRYLRVNPVHPRLVTFVLRLRRLLARHGGGLGVRELTGGGGVAARLVFLPREFQPAGATFDPSFHFVGPCPGERAFQGRWRPPAGEGPLVLVSLGTGYNRRPEFYRACAEAFADPSWRVVVAVGERVGPAELGPLPAHVQVHAVLPQLAVLRHADLFVTHAGMGSAMEALRHGVPVVAVPQMAEQRANADRLVELGLGRALDPARVDAAGLRRAARDVLADRGVRAAVARMRHAIDRSGGAPAAVDVVEGVLGARGA